MALRGYGWRAASGNSPSFSESAARFGFVERERVPERELVLGHRFDGDGPAKSVWNIQFSARGPYVTDLSTETWVLCFGPAARRKFLLYWTAIAPFSALTRVALLEGVRKEALRAEPCA